MNKPKSYIVEHGDAVELDEPFFSKARRGRPRLSANERKQQVTVRIDMDVIEALKKPDPKGWQTRLNAVLRSALKLEKA